MNPEERLREAFQARSAEVEPSSPGHSLDAIASRLERAPGPEATVTRLRWFSAGALATAAAILLGLFSFGVFDADNAGDLDAVAAQPESTEPDSNDSDDPGSPPSTTTDLVITDDVPAVTSTSTPPPETDLTCPESDPAGQSNDTTGNVIAVVYHCYAGVEPDGAANAQYRSFNLITDADDSLWSAVTTQLGQTELSGSQVFALNATATDAVEDYVDGAWIADGRAVVDLRQRSVDDMAALPGGLSPALTALAMTTFHFPAVREVEFRVEGACLEVVADTGCQVWLRSGMAPHTADVVGQPSVVTRLSGGDGLNVREGPGVDDPVITVLSPGEVGIRALDETRIVAGNTWRRVVIADNTEGWVNEAFLGFPSPDGDAEALPADAMRASLAEFRAFALSPDGGVDRLSISDRGLWVGVPGKVARQPLVNISDRTGWFELQEWPNEGGLELDGKSLVTLLGLNALSDVDVATVPAVRSDGPRGFAGMPALTYTTDDGLVITLVFDFRDGFAELLAANAAVG